MTADAHADPDFVCVDCVPSDRMCLAIQNRRPFKKFVRGLIAYVLVLLDRA